MRAIRRAQVRKINFLLGAFLIVAGITGGFLLLFWLLVILLPLSCIAASWFMMFTTQRARDVHVISSPILTGLFVLWLTYFIQHGPAMPVWHGMLLICVLSAGQVAVYLAANRPTGDAIDTTLT
jgi:hypothetical protein